MAVDNTGFGGPEPRAGANTRSASGDSFAIIQLKFNTVAGCRSLNIKELVILCLVDGNNPLTAFTVSNLVRQAIVVSCRRPSTHNSAFSDPCG